MSNIDKCPVCFSQAKQQFDFDRDTKYYTCPVCGRFQKISQWTGNMDHLAFYLCHCGYKVNSMIDTEYRYYTTLPKDCCDRHKKEFELGKFSHGMPVHIDEAMIENWYPKTFAEKIDHILLYLNSRIKHMGQMISLSMQETLSMLFIDRREIDSYNQEISRNDTDCEDEANYVLNYLQSRSYVQYEDGASEDDWISIRLAPDGYARVDELQRNTANGRSVLVAMAFGENTHNLREAIRKGITDAGYTATFIDEVQHNEFITPELLRHIRDSKFVVVDLTHRNNGAYFEEGYAMGLGKPVIQLCRKDVTLHFDIAQKNTIMWGEEDDIPVRLCNRIRATID